MAEKQVSTPALAPAAAPETDNFELLIQEEEDVQKKALTALPTKVVVHPLVLLSVVDHYHRIAENTNKRVCGVLLGTSHGTTVDVTNSYAGTSSYCSLLTSQCFILAFSVLLKLYVPDFVIFY